MEFFLTECVRQKKSAATYYIKAVGMIVFGLVNMSGRIRRFILVKEKASRSSSYIAMIGVG